VKWIQKVQPVTSSFSLSADGLIEKMKAYDGNVQEDLVRQAYAFSMKAHEKQKRASGEPYFTHPLAVAELLTSMHLDTSSIVTGLLHDTVEDTLTTVEEIRLFFGKDVAFLVDGVTKLTHVEELSDQAKQTEQFRKLLLAMSSDIRVLLVKLCDRVHNMRTLHFFPSEARRQRIALETLDIYAPLAERMGLRRIKEELEDLAFAELNPDVRLSLLSRLKFLRAQDEDFVTIVCQELEALLKGQKLMASVFGREKTPYSR
jgi:GTP pyrophosphokinase